MTSSETAPRVRVVVVNYNGGALTLDCLRSLQQTRWPADRLELVLVDNASHDGIADEVRRDLPEVRVVSSPRNVGFAGGSNLGMRDLDDVEYVALVNNDVTVQPGWLEPLVDALRRDPAVGAACPKILFAARYAEISLKTHTIVRGKGDSRALGVRLSGVQVDDHDVTRACQYVSGFWGLEYGFDLEEQYQWTEGEAVVRVPVRSSDPPPTARVRLAADAPTSVVLRSGTQEVAGTVDVEPSWHDIAIGGPAIDVVNNVGSVLSESGFGVDRGFLEPDDGRFDDAEDVFAWCGAAVVLSRAYLDDVGLFDEGLFLYYEDLELSWRGRERGWRTRYVPDSVVRHVHAATSGRDTLRFTYQNERNRLLVLARHERPSKLLRELSRFLLVTASYTRRDVVAPLRHGARPSTTLVKTRARALGGFLRRLPRALEARARDRSRPAGAPDRDVLT